MLKKFKTHQERGSLRTTITEKSDCDFKIERQMTFIFWGGVYVFQKIIFYQSPLAGAEETLAKLCSWPLSIFELPSFLNPWQFAVGLRELTQIRGIIDTV